MKQDEGLFGALPDKLKSTDLWLKRLPNIITAILAGVAVFFVSDQPTENSISSMNTKLDKIQETVSKNERAIERLETAGLDADAKLQSRLPIIGCSVRNFDRIFDHLKIERPCTMENLPE